MQAMIHQLTSGTSLCSRRSLPRPFWVTVNRLHLCILPALSVLFSFYFIDCVYCMELAECMEPCMGFMGSGCLTWAEVILDCPHIWSHCHTFYLSRLWENISCAETTSRFTPTMQTGHDVQFKIAKTLSELITSHCQVMPKSGVATYAVQQLWICSTRLFAHHVLQAVHVLSTALLQTLCGSGQHPVESLQV